MYIAGNKVKRFYELKPGDVFQFTRGSTWYRVRRLEKDFIHYSHNTLSNASKHKTYAYQTAGNRAQCFVYVRP